MSDRDDILKAIGADIRTWTIGPNGVSADGDEDTNSLLRVLSARPHLPRAFARQEDPEVEARMQRMLDITRRGGAAGAPPSVATGDGQRVGLPPNPMRMSHAIEQYAAAVTGEKLAERTVLERVRLLNGLVAHVVAATSGTNADPFVHDVGTHHLSTFLDSISTKAATSGENTDEPASPLTLIKKVGTMRRFFHWACEERQATAVNAASGLGRRDKALRRAASLEREHYEPKNSSYPGAASAGGGVGRPHSTPRDSSRAAGRCPTADERPVTWSGRSSCGPCSLVGRTSPRVPVALRPLGETSWRGAACPPKCCPTPVPGSRRAKARGLAPMPGRPLALGAASRSRPALRP